MEFVFSGNTLRTRWRIFEVTFFTVRRGSVLFFYLLLLLFASNIFNNNKIYNICILYIYKKLLSLFHWSHIYIFILAVAVYPSGDRFRIAFTSFFSHDYISPLFRSFLAFLPVHCFAFQPTLIICIWL